MEFGKVSDISHDELKRIVEAVIEALKTDNPGGFVTTSICNERYGWLKKAIIGLYGFIGAVLVAVLAVLITVILQS